MRLQAFLVVIAAITALYPASSRADQPKIMGAGAMPPGLVRADQPLALGAGTTVCGEFVSGAGPGGLSDVPSLQWVLGYLSGQAASSDKPHRALPGPDGIAREVLAYCQAHPYGRLADAAASLSKRKRICGAVHGCG